MDKELQKANQYMATLFNIEEYENLDFSKELNIEKLLKAKEYYLQKMIEYGTRLSEFEREVELAHTRYKLKFAEAVDRFCNTKDENGKNLSMGRAEYKATIDAQYIEAKDEYAELVGEKEYYKHNYYAIRERLSSIQQAISILRKEEDFTQFTKNNDNS